MRGLLIGLLLMAGPAVAQTAEQIDAVQVTADMMLLSDGCRGLEVDKNALGRFAIERNINSPDFSDTGRHKDIFQSTIRSVLIDRRDLGEAAKCEQAELLYGPNGSRAAGLVTVGAAPLPVATQAAPKPQRTVSPRVVAGADMQLAPRKWLGQPVEMRRMRCLHADKDEFRCITSDSSTLIIFAEAVSPPTMQDFVERSCGTFEEMLNPTCRFTLRFTAEQHGEDTISGYQKRTVIRAATVEAIREPARRR
jgi:hypothetical protein